MVNFSMICPDGGIGRRARFRCEWIISLEVRVFFWAFFVLVSNCLASNFKIFADNVDFNYKSLRCKLNGNAKIIYNNKIFIAQNITAEFYDNKFNKVKEIKAINGVNFIYDDIKIYAENCYTDNKMVIFSTNVIITHKKIGKITAPNAIYYIDEKKIKIFKNVNFTINFVKN